MNIREEAARYQGWAVAREALVEQRARGHIIAGLLPTTRPLGVHALCVQCGAELEVLFDQGQGLGGPLIQGRMRERTCGPAEWWAMSDRDDRVGPLAFLAREDPERDSLESLAQLLGITIGALHRLELYPFPSADPRESAGALRRMTRDTRAHADRLTEVLDAARGALAAEAQQARVAAGQAEIAQARAAVVAADQAAHRARVHLDALLGLATTPAVGGQER